MTLLKIKRVQETIKEFPHLGKRIKEAREKAKIKEGKSLSSICREADISRAYWYQLESEDLRAPATEEIIRKIEQTLNIDLGVTFDE
ncbi:XRE family transcriptional regulator [Hyella patelloides LEGE 07179]|uniref:XRE family transcriptional regulator n=1 Tax=Hyella patelloides LEGE 07179 TaxID=945734 RepID=A0A563W0Z9_9CYAN|nr:helix-turn-helix transcriptional regulator [Hyella patelloides]VEP17307.1 XRE family transcriptional regulator [Hyella patelloides LEGE 07179]